MKDIYDIGYIYDTWSLRLYNICLRIVGDEAEAEEIMHDTLLKYDSFGRKEDIRDIGKWLSSICIRKSIDRLRQKHRYKDFLTRYAEEEAEVEQSDEEPGEYSMDNIRKALAALPDHYRTILSLHLFEGYDYQEISQITGTKETTIRTLYMRGRGKLADILWKEWKNT